MAVYDCHASTSGCQCCAHYSAWRKSQETLVFLGSGSVWKSGTGAPPVESRARCACHLKLTHYPFLRDPRPASVNSIVGWVGTEPGAVATASRTQSRAIVPNERRMIDFKA